MKPLKSGQHTHTRPGPRFEYCETVISRNIMGMAQRNMKRKYGTKKAPKTHKSYTSLSQHLLMSEKSHI